MRHWRSQGWADNMKNAKSLARDLHYQGPTKIVFDRRSGTYTILVLSEKDHAGLPAMIIDAEPSEKP